MRTLVLTDHYPPYYEGAYELMCRQVVEGLQAHGHTMTVLTTTFGIDTPTIDDDIYRLLYFLREEYTGWLGRRQAQFQQLEQGKQNYRLTRRLLQDIKPDVVFIWNVEAASILPILAAQDEGKRLVFRVGSHWLVHLKKEYVGDPSRLRRSYRSALLGFRRFEELRLDTVIFNSESLRQSYLEAGFELGHSIVIPNGLTDDELPQQPTIRQRSEHTPLRLLYAGRLEIEKGPQIAVQALEYLVKSRGLRNLSLSLVGRGNEEYVEELRQLIVKSNLQDLVQILGFLPRPALMQRYAEHDILLFPSLRWEGHPVTVIEAMAHGLTVIASDIGGPKDTIEEGRNGFLVPPNDPIKLAAAIEKIANEPSLLGQVGRAASETARTKYRFDTMLERYEIFLEEITSLPADRHSLAKSEKRLT